MRMVLCGFAICASALAQVSFERIKQAEREPGNWLTYSGNYSAHRHSPLNQINVQNVEKLKPAWVYQTSSVAAVESTPLVVDGVMYLTEPPSNVTALDTRTGRPLWRYQRTVPKDVRVCCGQVNRGVAILDETVYVGTVDAHLIALDAKTGSVRWDSVVAEYKTGYAITVAPLAVRDKVIVGIAGGEYGVRGFIDAYDARTGKRAWRFWTIPGPGEPGNETWAGDSWKTGSGTTWVTGAYDPDLDLVYWGTGNPGPDWNGERRTGDNLYSDSVVALDSDSGKLKWHFQFTPHDVHDWDSTEVPVLASATIRGRERKVILFANRNAFYYVLDRETGEFLHGGPYAKQTWATGLDDRGRPMLVPGMEPSDEGTKVYPNVGGATNWFSPSYSPLTRLFYVATREHGGIYYKGEAEYRAGDLFNGGGSRDIPNEIAYGAIRALKPTGELQWEYKIFSPPSAGLLSTAGDLVFGSTNEGDVFALNARSGKPLWRFQTGGTGQSNPISYLSDGRQHVAIATGNALFAFALE
ncbi:MAG TPA: PQQ-dependent dehydrogenase, methanol/ethanol family [Bryobacteraceae bacterium]|nr:PQQ-dependent dehydrogenase, methanol/ethanol family [Bryobacteraceae bacterium]